MSVCSTYFFSFHIYCQYMASSEEQRLWEATTTGDLDTVKSIMEDLTCDVNWVGEDRLDTPLHRACRFGRTEIVRELVRDPRVDVNKGNKGGASPLYIACQESHPEIVQVLLRDRRVDVNKPSETGATPFLISCENGESDAVVALLGHPLVDVNQIEMEGCSPLWMAAHHGRLLVAQHVLASGRRIVTQARAGGEPQMSWAGKTAAEVGRVQAWRKKFRTESEEDFSRRVRCGPLIGLLVDSFEKDPEGVRMILRNLPGVRDPFIGKLFALVVFFSDNFLLCPVSGDARRFFKLAARLPLDLQMLLCNRAYRSPRDIVLSRYSEAGFRWLAAPFRPQTG